MKPINKAILFFDGECGLCSRTVRLLIRRDRHRHLFFAPLQGVTAQAILPLKYRKSVSTIVYHRSTATKPKNLLVRSDAVLQALLDIGGFSYFVAKILRLFPLRFRDWCYDYIANNRHRFFRNNTCRLPTREEHARILP